MEREKWQIIQLLRNNKKGVYSVLKLQDGSIKDFMKTIEELEAEGLLYFSNGELGLTRKGKELSAILPNVKCKNCEGSGYSLSKFYLKILSKFRALTKKRPEAAEKYDQGFMREIDVIRRVEFLHERGDLNGELFVVGDDDMFSIAAALTGLPKRVVAVDVDERIVEFINSIAAKEGLRLTARIYDIQEKLCEEFEKNFDVFVTDPVETIPGITLFLSRGAAALKGKGASGYFGLTTLEAGKEKWYEIQKLLLSIGFVITDIRRNFSFYPPTKKNFSQFMKDWPVVKRLGLPGNVSWYNSSFIRIEAVRDPRPPITTQHKLEKEMFIDEEALATSPYKA